MEQALADPRWRSRDGGEPAGDATSWPRRAHVPSQVLAPGDRPRMWPPAPRRAVLSQDAAEEDRSLVLRCRAGDEAAWTALVGRHTRMVLAVAWRFTGRTGEAEDLAQEVFVRVFRALHLYRPADGAFGAWLAAVARNVAIDHYRRRREEWRRREHGDVLSRLAGEGEGPFQGALRGERVRLVRRAIATLPLEYREAIVLCDLQGASHEEAASALEVPLGTIKSRLSRGRLELAKRLTGRTRGERP